MFLAVTLVVVSAGRSTMLNCVRHRVWIVQSSQLCWQLVHSQGLLSNTKIRAKYSTAQHRKRYPWLGLNQVGNSYPGISLHCLGTTQNLLTTSLEVFLTVHKFCSQSVHPCLELSSINLSISPRFGSQALQTDPNKSSFTVVPKNVSLPHPHVGNCARSGTLATASASSQSWPEVAITYEIIHLLLNTQCAERARSPQKDVQK